MAVQGHAAAQATPSASPSSQGGICNVSSRPLLCPPHACGRHPAQAAGFEQRRRGI